MSKVSITELASKLMEKHGLKRTEAELFIRQFVGVINDGLKNDKSVKVKGLGKIGYVANSPFTVKGESMSAGRLYDKIGDKAKGKVVFVVDGGVVCRITDIEMNKQLKEMDKEL